MAENNQSFHQKSRYAVVFPGQGSQSLGMLSELSEQYDEIKDTFNEASEALGFDVWELCHDESRLNLTKYTQPALLTASIAIWRVLETELFGLVGQPVYLAGHSLGEYSAMCASGMISLGEAVKLVHKRGQLMQDAVIGQNGMMAAVIGLEDQQVINLCEQVLEMDDEAIVSPANFNSPGQVVIAGNKVGVEAVIHQVKDNMGKKAIPLKVSVPSHCKMMAKASESLQEVLSTIQISAPLIPVIQNRHAKVEASLTDMGKALVEQLDNPVQWSHTMQALTDKKIDFIVECGNGNVLSNLAKRQTTPLTAYPTDKLARLQKLFDVLQSA